MEGEITRTGRARPEALELGRRAGRVQTEPLGGVAEDFPAGAAGTPPVSPVRIKARCGAAISRSFTWRIR